MPGQDFLLPLPTGLYDYDDDDGGGGGGGG